MLLELDSLSLWLACTIYPIDLYRAKIHVIIYRHKYLKRRTDYHVFNSPSFEDPLRTKCIVGIGDKKNNSSTLAAIPDKLIFSIPG